MSQAILNGLVPYRDFFLADPPLFPLLFSLAKLLVGSKLILLKLWPIIFDSISAILIFLILKEKKVVLAILGPLLYLFSFLVISTSDYVTGGEIMIFFMLLAFLLNEKKRPLLSGIAWALSCLSKLYAAPALIGFLAYQIYKKNFSELRSIILGGILATSIIIVPFLFLAHRELFDNLILHQFSRPAGLDKMNILSFFIKYDWLLILTAILGGFFTKNKGWLWPLGLSLVFFLWYPDLYYLYLHLIIPFLVILSVEFIDFLYHKESDIALGYVLLYIMLSIYPISSYVSTISQQGVFTNPYEIGNFLEQTPEPYPILGVQEVAPLIALISNRGIFNNVIDSNTQSFASGAQSRDEISRQAVKEGVFLISRAAEYPKLGVSEANYEGYFDPEIFKSSCTLYKSFDRSSPAEQLNKINVYRCYNSSL